MEAFPLPYRELRHGPWTCHIADPRDNPLALGSRFIHGGYIAELSHAGRPLTNRAIDHWDSYYGQGLPEVFDEPLGFAAAQNGEAYMRIGAGQCERTQPGRHGSAPLIKPVHWQLLQHSEQHCSWQCRDHATIGGEAYAYELKRSVSLHDKGLCSVSSLTVTCPWSEPLSWFPHPYFQQLQGDGCRVHVPEHCRVNNQQLGVDTWQGSAEGDAFAVVSGLWGHQRGVVVDLDPACGGGSLDLRLDRPLDKIVLWANQRSFAAEPYWCHAFANGEQAQWTVNYGFSPQTTAL